MGEYATAKGQSAQWMESLLRSEMERQSLVNCSIDIPVCHMGKVSTDFRNDGGEVWWV